MLLYETCLLKSVVAWSLIRSQPDEMQESNFGYNESLMSLRHTLGSDVERSLFSAVVSGSGHFYAEV